MHSQSTTQAMPPTTFLKSHFLRLPVELQMTVVHMVDRRVKRLLCLVNKRLNQLATPELYSGVILKDQALDTFQKFSYLKRQNTLSDRQDKLYDTITSRPELGSMVRTLRWHQHPKSAEVLSHTSNVRYLETDGWVLDEGQEASICNVKLPRLKVAVIQGLFPPNGISTLLSPANTSLEELALGSTAGELDHQISDLDRHQKPSIASFVNACTTNKWFPHLRVLSLERKVLSSTEIFGGSDDETTIGWSRLIRHYAPQLERLLISLERDGSWVKYNLEEAFERHILPILLSSSGDFTNLQRIEFRGFSVSATGMRVLRERFSRRATKVEIRMVSVLKTSTLIDEA
ncbi:hypothetical protein FRC03_009444 [Tulasnella sp. 419]|nr:hypothetical protein FRC03_009444 [Tulasnella sp. 419]